MASHAPDFGRASTLPLSAVLAAVPSYPRPVIERLVARLIDHLDTLDPDPDEEDDDPAGGNVEDEGEQEEHDAAFGGPRWGGGRDSDLTPYRFQPHHDLVRVKRQLRQIKRRAK